MNIVSLKRNSKGGYSRYRKRVNTIRSFKNINQDFMKSKDKYPERIGTQGWEQFQATKQEMLYQFEIAKKYSKSHIVQTSHGNVAEALFRKWLNSFLPKKYAVTSGYIISQGSEFKDKKLPHYDVIIYDQLNSPVLWVEENNDHSTDGKTKAIPVEHVKAVFEVKSNLTRASSKKAMDKINELLPLIREGGEPEHYLAGKLPYDFISGIVFFELKKENEYDKQILNNLVPNQLIPFYGSLILSAEGRSIDDACVCKMLISESVIKSSVGRDRESIISGSPLSDSKEVSSGVHQGTMMLWSPSSFSIFAFDIIAILEKRYRPNYISSQYGLSWMNPERHKNGE